MKCPHCGDSFYFEPYEETPHKYSESREDGATGWELAHGFCPSCKELIVVLRDGDYMESDSGYSRIDNPRNEQIIYPITSSRRVEPEVPKRYKGDFLEAVSVLQLSPKASAAISRRLLQDILRCEYKINPANLAIEIENFISRKDVPSHLAEAVDAIRNVGNFAVHPLKDTNTREIVEVEDGEAEWLLDVLEALFDFAFVQPRRLKERRNRLNKKLRALGKPPMKGT